LTQTRDNARRDRSNQAGRSNHENAAVPGAGELGWSAGGPGSPPAGVSRCRACAAGRRVARVPAMNLARRAALSAACTAWSTTAEYCGSAAGRDPDHAGRPVASGQPSAAAGRWCCPRWLTGCLAALSAGTSALSRSPRSWS